ncbi:MAG: hypothetical protein AB8B55_18085 [Mariniblastus sp.]
MIRLRCISTFVVFNCVFLLASMCSVVNAKTQVETDKMGFRWDMMPGGAIEDGNEDIFDGAFALYLNSDNFAPGAGVQQGKMYVFGPAPMGSVTVTRHLLVVDDPVGLVYADTYHNTSKSEQAVAPRIYSDFGEAATPQRINGKSGGMVAMRYPHGPPRNTVVCLFGDKATSYLPQMSGSGDTYWFEYPSMKLAPGQKKAVGYFVAQRRRGTAEKLYTSQEAFMKSIGRMASLKNFNFVNLPGMGLFDTGEFGIVNQAPNDFISTRKKDEVFGKLITREFELTTDIGKRNYTAEQIVNALNVGDGRYKVAADDGSLLEGTLSPEKVQFELSDGGSGEIDLKNVARLVPKLPNPAEKQKAGRWFEFKTPIFVFASNERLTGQFATDSFEIHTEIGKLDLPIKSIQSIQLARGDSGLSSKFVTMDGQRFSGLIYDEFEITIFDGSIRKVSPKELTAVFLNDTTTAPRATGGKKQAYIKMGGDDFLYAELITGQQKLEFETDFGTRGINPNQISALKTLPGLKGGMQITFWDGSKLRGNLTSEHLVLKILEKEMKIPAQIIKEFNNPMATPPQAIRDRYIKLIRQLGSKKYEERSAAVQTLEPDKEKIRGLLKSQLDKVDIETKARIWKLLPDEDRPKQAK